MRRVQLNRRTGGTKACARCGGRFEAWSGRPDSRFCSRECGWEYQKARAVAGYPPKGEVELAYARLRSMAELAKHYGRSQDWAKRVLVHHGIPELVRRETITCQECGRSFEVKTSQVANGCKYCSIACRSAKDRRPPEAV